MTKDLSVELGLAISTLEKQISKLTKLGLIVRQGSKKTGGYVLTPKGLSLFKK